MSRPLVRVGKDVPVPLSQEWVNKVRRNLRSVMLVYRFPLSPGHTKWLRTYVPSSRRSLLQASCFNCNVPRFTYSRVHDIRHNTQNCWKRYVPAPAIAAVYGVREISAIERRTPILHTIFIRKTPVSIDAVAFRHPYSLCRKLKPGPNSPPAGCFRLPHTAATTTTTATLNLTRPRTRTLIR